MYEEQKYGITFSVDARVELIFGILSKLKNEHYDLLLKANPHYEEDDYIESFDSNHYNEYANKMYGIIDFKKHPKLLKWALIIINEDEGLVPTLALMLDDNFEEKEDFKCYDNYKDFFLNNNYREFLKALKEFVDNEKYLEFYKNNFNEFHKMIDESNDNYPNNLDVNDIEKYYGNKLTKYPVTYSIFFNGGFGVADGDIPVCFKGLWVDDNGKYYESVSGIINLYHEWSHPVINPLVDKYWDIIEHKDEFLNYSIQNNLHKTYQVTPKTVYYEYYVRAMSYIMASKYKDCKRSLEWYKEIGFIKIEEIIDFINNNFKIGENFEEFFVNKLIPYTNKIANEIIDINQNSKLK